MLTRRRVASIRMHDLLPVSWHLILRRGRSRGDGLYNPVIRDCARGSELETGVCEQGRVCDGGQRRDSSIRRKVVLTRGEVSRVCVLWHRVVDCG